MQQLVEGQSEKGLARQEARYTMTSTNRNAFRDDAMTGMTPQQKLDIRRKHRIVKRLVLKARFLALLPWKPEAGLSDSASVS